MKNYEEIEKKIAKLRRIIHFYDEVINKIKIERERFMGDIAMLEEQLQEYNEVGGDD